MTWTVEGAITQSKAEILRDIADGTVPATVRTFSELHDYVDANVYGGLCDDGVWEVLSEDVTGKVNRVQDTVNDWLAIGRPTEACGPRASTWFGVGRWPDCTCGFAPRDNDVLTRHWAEAGFRVVDDHGHLQIIPIGEQVTP